MTFRHFYLISDDAGLVSQLEGPLQKQFEIAPTLAAKGSLTRVALSDAMDLIERAAQHSTVILVDVRQAGPGALLPHNIHEGGGAFFLLASLFPDALVMALATTRIADRIREGISSYDAAAYPLLEPLIVTSAAAVPETVERATTEPPPLFDPRGRRFILRDVVSFGLTSRRRNAEIKAQTEQEIFILEDDRATALALAAALYSNGLIVSLINSMRDLENAVTSRMAGPPQSGGRRPRLAIVDYELAFSDYTPAIAPQETDYLPADQALDRLFPDELERPNTTVMITGAAGEQLRTARALAKRRGYGFRTKPFRSAEGEVRAVLGNNAVTHRRALTPPRTQLRHTAPRSLIVIAEAMMKRARKLSQSDRFDDLAVASVLAADTLDLLKHDRSSLMIEALQLQERSGLQLELTAAGSEANIDLVPRIQRIDRQLGLHGDRPAFGLSKRGALQVRMRLLVLLRRILVANDQLRGTEQCIREIGNSHRQDLARVVKDTDAKTFHRLLALLRWLATAYIDKTTDNGLSITRVAVVMASWWLVLSVAFAALFIIAGSSPSLAASSGSRHAASTLLAYPGASGAEYFQARPGYQELADNLATNCILVVSPGCRSNVGTVYSLLSVLGRLLSLLHLSLVASILFRKITHKAG